MANKRVNAMAVWIEHAKGRGADRGPRRILPFNLFFEQEWKLSAWDLEKDVEQIFAMQDILSWGPATKQKGKRQ